MNDDNLTPSENSVDIREVVRDFLRETPLEYRGSPSSILYRAILKDCNPIMCMTPYAIRRFLSLVYGPDFEVEEISLDPLVFYKLTTKSSQVTIVVDVNALTVAYDIWNVSNMPEKEPYGEFAEFFKPSSSKVRTHTFF
jgi:hypothetical protein